MQNSLQSLLIGLLPQTIKVHIKISWNGKGWYEKRSAKYHGFAITVRCDVIERLAI